MKYLLIFTLFYALTISQTSAQTNKIQYKKLSDTTFQVGDLILLSNIQFEIGKCEFFQNCRDFIKTIADFSKKHPTFKIEIGVHTIVRGKADTNLLLTQCRATKILAYITKELILSPDNIEAKGYGDTRPLYSKDYLDKLIYQDPNDKAKIEELHNKNKRVEIKILQTK